MPFKSEKQRRYLWANEPEIARDWTDTYGSGIAKALGGRIGYNRGRVVNPGGYAGDDFFTAEEQAKLDAMRKSGNVPRVFSDEELARFKAMENDPNFGQGEGETAWEAHTGIQGENPEYAREVNKASETAVNEYLEKIRSGEIAYPNNLQLEMDNLSNKVRREMWGKQKLNEVSDQPEIFSDKSNRQAPQSTVAGPMDYLQPGYELEQMARDSDVMGRIETLDAPAYKTKTGLPFEKGRQNITPEMMETEVARQSILPEAGLGTIETAYRDPIMDMAAAEKPQIAEEDEDDTQSRWNNLLKQAAGSQIARKLGLAVNPALMFSGLRGGIGNFANTMRGGLTQRGYEQARDARKRQSRIDHMLDRRGAGKGWGVKNLNQLTMGSRPGFYGNVPTYDLPQTTKPPSRPYSPPARPHGGNGGGNQGSQSSRGGAPSHSTRDLMAYGGIIGSVGGISRPKYQEGNMVGAEMEGAVMESQEAIKELYEALIAQGLSPEAAMEKVKEIIADSETEGPESPMMAEEFPGQEFGRAPAAFGGIMDTYTGRRKYGFGSFIKKAVKKATKAVKKIAKSPIGKAALLYTATAGLGNLAGGLGGATKWGNMFGKAGWMRPSTIGANLFGRAAIPGTWSTGTAMSAPGMGTYSGAPATGGILSKLGLTKGGGSMMPTGKGWGALGAAATLAPFAMQPKPDELPEIDMAGQKFDFDYGQMRKDIAGAVAGGDYNEFTDVLSNYGLTEGANVPYWGTLAHAAEGGRVGAQEGGLMNLGGMEKDYRNDGGFVPIGGEEKADDVPARLSRNEFVFTADAVRNAGGGDIDKGAEVMENVMKNLEAGGKVSEESQGQGAQEMFEVSERLSEVV